MSVHLVYTEDVPRYLVVTRMTGESYCRMLGSLLMYLRYVC